MPSELDSVKRDVAIANRILAELGFASGVLASLGHASMRLPGQPERFVVKGRGGFPIDALAVMRPEDMLICDLEGFKVEGPEGSIPVNEIKMHSCIYRENPQVQSVVHVHPRFAVVMSVLQAGLGPMCVEGIQLVSKPLPVFESPRLIITDDDGVEVAKLLGNSKAILLQGHGAATVGANLEEAVMNMLQLEEQAKMNWYAYCAAGKDHPVLSQEKVGEFAANMRRMADQPHLQPDKPRTGPPGPGGVWTYYADVVSREM